MINFRDNKIIILSASSVLIVLVLFIMGGQLLSNTDNDINDIVINMDGLLVPTQEEARLMVPPMHDVPSNSTNSAESAYPSETDNLSIPGHNPNQIFPSSYDIHLAESKRLAVDGEFTRQYLYMQALYRKSLEYFLERELNLSTFDNMLINHELGFTPVPREFMNFHQRYSTFDFSFIYLRNNLPIERLSLGEIEVLRQHINSGSIDITEELLALVEKTYRRILLAYEDRAPDFSVSYRPWGPGGLSAPNNALVLVISFSEVDNTEFVLEEFIPMMEQNLSEKLSIPIVIFGDLI